MKIGLDYISSFGRAGTGMYTRELIRNLALIDKKNTYYLYTYLHKGLFNKQGSQLIRQDNFKYRPVISPLLTDKDYILAVLRKIRELIFSMSYELNNLDLFHLTNPVNYYKSLDNFIITVHDIAPFYSEGFVKESSISLYKKYFKQMINRARCIIVDAKFTKIDILSKFNIEEGKIRIIPLAADDAFKPVYNLNILKKYGLDKKYILSVGQLQPRKNLLILLKVYSLLPEKFKREYDLVLVGSPREQVFLDKLKKNIVEQKIQKNVKILGYLNDQELPILYSHAYIFVYLSLLEGFGLPPLESLKCGRPVLVADNSTLPEVVGLAGLKVNPKNIEQIVLKLKRLLENQHLVDDLIKNIPNQVKKFSWQKTAKQTLQVYREFI